MDSNKAELYKIKEELYFVIDEKQHQADLTEIGRTRLRPDNPDAFMLPDLATEFSDLDKDTATPIEEREARKLASQERYAAISEGAEQRVQTLHIALTIAPAHRAVVEI